MAEIAVRVRSGDGEAGRCLIFHQGFGIEDSMRVDFEDVLSGVFISIAARVMLLAAAVWTGCTIGAVAVGVGVIAEAGSWNIGMNLSKIWLTPLLGFHGWGLLNIPFLLLTFVFLVFTDRPGYRAWGIVTGVESLMVMAGWAQEEIDEWLPRVAAWAAWLILLAMLETGVWLTYQSKMNRWAREMGLLRMENRQRREEAAEDDDDAFPDAEPRVNDGP
ncbi:MAG: hypothetical protein ABIT37_14015 [Luteolibacter sp.]